MLSRRNLLTGAVVVAARPNRTAADAFHQSVTSR